VARTGAALACIRFVAGGSGIDGKNSGCWI